jgi:hypothetical protein
MSNDIVKRLDNCWAMLENEGFYTKANTVMLAKQRIKELEAENVRLKALVAAADAWAAGVSSQPPQTGHIKKSIAELKGTINE